MSTSIDALARATTALQTGQPNLSELTQECIQIIRITSSVYKHDDTLKLASVLTMEQIITEARSFHGEDALSYTVLGSRINRAKKAVAKARGVAMKVIADEVKENQALSGVVERWATQRRASRAANISSRAEQQGGGWVNCSEMQLADFFHGVGSSNRRSNGQGGRRAKVHREADEDESEELDPSELVTEDQYQNPDVEHHEGRLTGAKRAATQYANLYPYEAQRPYAAENGRGHGGPVYTPPSPLIPPRQPLEPFGPTPYGQPPVGTELYEP